MPQPRRIRFSNSKIRVAAALAAISLAVVVLGPQAQAASSKRVVKQARNAELGKTILTTLTGRTLYTLSAETNGRFICKSRACLEAWHPLYVAAGVKPAGPVKLGTVKRPSNGRRQVIFRGRPLYTFVEDKRAGDAEGEGFKDVGTWHAAAP